MPNVVQAWLELIGTPERAQQLQASMAGGWNLCPSHALYGAHAHSIYANRRYTAALDAWDTGMVTRRDVLQWAAYVASGAYNGPVYEWQVRLSVNPFDHAASQASARNALVQLLSDR